MIYIALLRGINVGGRNKIDMKLLKQAFERAGMKNVLTYINSGNIIFNNTEYSKGNLSQVLEDVIYDTFNLQIDVLLYSQDDFQKIAQAVPTNWTNDQQMKSDVLFLWADIDEESVLDRLVIKPGIDQARYVPGAILWSVDKSDFTKSGMSKIAGSNIYRHVTIRNVNTVRKLADLIQVAEE